MPPLPDQIQQRPGHPRYCELYGQWKKKLNPTMRQRHRAGEKTFVDFSGKKPHIVDPKMGELVEMELFVGTLGASSYTYVEATLNQSLESWAKAHKGMSDYFGGSTEIWVPDNLKSGVDLVDRYEPGINRTYEELATHYGAVVVPARVFKPKDKAKVESAVQVAQRWILAVLRHRTFFSLAELNEAIWEKLEVLNARPMQKLGVSRRELYERLDPARTETATAGELRVIDVEAVQSEHRLPRGGGEQLVQRSLSAHSRESRGTGDGLGGGGPVQGKARRVASPQERKGALLHEPGAYATFASGAPGVDAVAAAPLGGAVRSRYGKAGCGDSRESASPGAGISLLPGSHATRQPLGQ